MTLRSPDGARWAVRYLTIAILITGSMSASAQSLPDRAGQAAVAERTGSRLATRNAGQGRIATRIPSRIVTRLQTRLDDSYNTRSGILDPLERTRVAPGPVATPR